MSMTQRSIFVTITLPVVAAAPASTGEHIQQPPHVQREIHLVEFLPTAAKAAAAAAASEAGESNLKTVFCMHGLSRTSKDFEYFGRSVAAKLGMRVLSIDNIGRGLSSWALDDASAIHEYTIGNYVTIVAHVLSALNIKKLHAWVGQSQGGFVGIAAAAASSAVSASCLIERLILIDVAPELHLPGLLRIIAAPTTATICKSFRDLRALYVERYSTFSTYAITDAALLDEFVAHHARRLPNGDFAMQCDPRAIANLKNDVADQILRAQCNGSVDAARQRILADPEAQWQTFKAIPGTTRISIVRGADSDLCTAEIAEKVKAKAAAFGGLVTIPHAGHCPLLFTDDEVHAVLELLA